MGDHVQAGVVARLHRARSTRTGLIKTHEHTRKDKEDDRTRHVDELNANDEPVFLTYRPARRDRRARRHGAGGRRRCTTSSPTTASATPSGSSPSELDRRRWSRAFAEVPALYVADGHHRTAAAARVGLERARRQPAPHRRRAVQLLHGGASSRTTSCRSWTTTGWSRTCTGCTPEAFLARVARSSRSRPTDPPRPEAPRPVRHVPGRPLVPARGEARERTRPSDPVRAPRRLDPAGQPARADARHRATRAPTSASTSSAASAASASWSAASTTGGRWRSPCTRPRSTSSWRWPTPAR